MKLLLLLAFPNIVALDAADPQRACGETALTSPSYQEQPEPDAARLFAHAWETPSPPAQFPPATLQIICAP